jgi:hypothetical protein
MNVQVLTQYANRIYNLEKALRRIVEKQKHTTDDTNQMKILSSRIKQLQAEIVLKQNEK